MHKHTYCLSQANKQDSDSDSTLQSSVNI